MSYFDSLQSFQSSASAIQEQSENAQQEYRDKKATSVEDKFEYVNKLMNESGGAIGGLGGGYHIGFKMYKKVKNARQTAKKVIEDAKNKTLKESSEATTNDTSPEEHLTQRPNGEEDSANGDKTDSVIDKSKIDTSQGEEVDTGSSLPPSEGEISTDILPKAPDPSLGSSKFADDSGTDLFQQLSQKPLLEQYTGGSGGQNLGDVIKQQTASEGKTEDAIKPAQTETTGIEHDSSLPPTNEPSSIVEDTDGIANKVNGISNKITSTVKDMKQGVSDLKGTVKSGAEKIIGSDAVETIGGIADFLGPVGELVGAGLALGSFFHNVFDKKRKEREENEAENKPSGLISGGGGISTESLNMASVKSNVIGTLV